jgi:hypothetical protein
MRSFSARNARNTTGMTSLTGPCGSSRRTRTPLAPGVRFINRRMPIMPTRWARPEDPVRHRLCRRDRARGNAAGAAKRRRAWQPAIIVAQIVEKREDALGAGAYLSLPMQRNHGCSSSDQVPASYPGAPHASIDRHEGTSGHALRTSPPMAGLPFPRSRRCAAAATWSSNSGQSRRDRGRNPAGRAAPGGSRCGCHHR